MLKLFPEASSVVKKVHFCIFHWRTSPRLRTHMVCTGRALEIWMWRFGQKGPGGHLLSICSGGTLMVTLGTTIPPRYQHIALPHSAGRPPFTPLCNNSQRETLVFHLYWLLYRGWKSSHRPIQTASVGTHLSVVAVEVDFRGSLLYIAQYPLKSGHVWTFCFSWPCNFVAHATDQMPSSLLVTQMSNDKHETLYVYSCLWKEVILGIPGKNSSSAEGVALCQYSLGPRDMWIWFQITGLIWGLHVITRREAFFECSWCSLNLNELWHIPTHQDWNWK